MTKPMKIILTISAIVGIVLLAAMLFIPGLRLERSMHPGDGEHMHMAHETEGLVPSGSLQDGVRVVIMKARRFEFDPATVVVRQGETVRLELTSEDTTHGIRIDDFDIERELPQDETQVIEFTADQAGEHHFHCSVFCGDGHDDMHGRLVVLSD